MHMQITCDSYKLPVIPIKTSHTFSCLMKSELQPTNWNNFYTKNKFGIVLQKITYDNENFTYCVVLAPQSQFF